MTQRPKTPFGWTTFCDDVRREVGGKFSLIGIYNNALLFEQNQFPIGLPQLWVVTHIFQRPSEGLDPFRIKIWLPGSDKPAFDQLHEPQKASNLTHPAVDPEDPLMSMVSFAQITPFIAAEEGVVNVDLQRGDLTLNVGRLWVSNAQRQDEWQANQPKDDKP